MFYAVIHRPEVDVSPIKSISSKYDPYYGLTGPHVTLVFPFKADEVSKDAFLEHVREVAAQTQPFNIRLNELELAWDQWLFLTPSSGRQQVVNLHDDLYGGLISKFLREDIEFVPHVSLGLFSKNEGEYDLKDPKATPLDEPKYKEALKEIEALKIDLEYKATKLEIISVDEKFTKTETIEVINLGKN